MEWPTDVGLGLENDELRLDRTSQAWIDAGTRLRDNVAGRLAGSVVGVEQIGSSSVLTLLAKPIVDIAVGLGDEHELSGAVFIESQGALFVDGVVRRDSLRADRTGPIFGAETSRQLNTSE